MSIEVVAESIDKIDPDLQKYVTESDGKLVFDNESFKKGLIAEREISAGLKAELSQYKNSGMSADDVKAFAALGKKPSEISDIIAKANTPSNSQIDTVKYLEMQKELELAREFRAKYEAERAKVMANTRDKLVRELIRKMPEEYDRERFEVLAEDVLFDKFSVNEAGDALEAVGDKLPADYLAEFAKKHGMLKTSTAGNANAGNATLNASGKVAAFNTAKENRNYGAMINNAPVIQ